MAKIRLPYSKFRIPPSEPFPDGNEVWRPYALATLTASNGSSVRCLVWLDSGADSCLFPLSLALLLKLDVLHLPKALTGGVGSGANVTYYDHISISLDHGIAFRTYAGFTQGMEGHGIGLLGQDGFFSNYYVEFRRAQRLFTIEPVMPSLG